MEKQKGYKYIIEGHQDLDNFAKGILALTNLRSNEQGVIDFRTFIDSQKVVVITKHDNDAYLESYVGEIIEKKEIDLFVADDTILTFYLKKQKIFGNS